MKTTQQKIKIFEFFPAQTKIEWLDTYNNMYLNSLTYNKQSYQYKECIDNMNKILMFLKFKTI